MKELPLLGWREDIALPALGIAHITAKLDTGARTSAIHAFDIEKTGRRRMRFGVHPVQDNPRTVWCEAMLVDERTVIDTSGRRELRPVIRTAVILGGYRWTIEATLTARDAMRHRVLLGRTALAGRFVINPAASFLMGKP
ncbi:MAG: RimK/LysX family protein [Pseudomonadota bacterium]